MKKTRFFLTALLLMTVLVFAACGSKDDNNDGIPDDQAGSVEQDLERGAEDIADDAEDLGEDVVRGAEDAADDVVDDVDDAADDVDDADDVNRYGTKTEAGDVSRNTADNGTYSNVQ